MNARTWIVLTLGLATQMACAKPAPVASSEAQRAEQTLTGTPTTLPDVDLEALAREVAAWRGLPAAALPSMQLAADTEAAKGHLDAQRELLARMFYDDALAIPALPRETIARYDATADAILIGPHDAFPEDVVADALACALLDALERHHLGDEAPDAPQTLDAHYAQRALAEGVCAMLVTERRLARRGTPLPTRTIVEHPDILRIADDPTPGREPGVERALAHDGAVFAAALFRAHGFSGLGMAQQQPPKTTGSLAQVARWMRGEDEGEVLLPPEVGSAWVDEGWREVRRGSIGGASTAKLLEDAAGTENTRQISSLWLADHWRAYEQDASTGMLWVSVWSTPYAAEAVRALLEHTLERRAGPKDVFGVWQDGVVVVLGMAHGISDVPNALQIARKATSARARFPMRDGITLGRYVPSAAERIVLGARAQRLDADLWRDDELGVSLDLSALDAWDVELSSRGLVRWYAKKDGAHIQWTAEVLDPLGPSPDSEAYVARWRDALAATLITDAPPSIDVLDDGTLHTTMTGRSKSDTVSVSAWQLIHEGVVFTLSITGAPDAHDAHVASAKAVADAWRASRTVRPDEAGQEEQTGIVEFHVEE